MSQSHITTTTPLSHPPWHIHPHSCQHATVINTKEEQWMGRFAWWRSGSRGGMTWMRAREGASRALRGVCVFLYVFYLFINDLYRFLLYKKSQATTSTPPKPPNGHLYATNHRWRRGRGDCKVGWMTTTSVLVPQTMANPSYIQYHHCSTWWRWKGLEMQMSLEPKVSFSYSYYFLLH